MHISYKSNTNLHKNVGLILTETLLILAFPIPILLNIPLDSTVLSQALVSFSDTAQALSLRVPQGWVPSSFSTCPPYGIASIHKDVNTMCILIVPNSHYKPNVGYKPPLLHKSHFVQKLNS